MSSALNTRKRGLNVAGLDTANIVDSPRKRRNVQQPQEESISKSPSPPPPAIKKITLRLRKKSNNVVQDLDTASSAADDNASTAASDDLPAEHEASELGERLWNTIKGAQDEHGRHMATDFLKLPSRRMYPGYYKVIKRPISLEEIKSKLDTNGYTSLNLIKADFDLMFRNAKRFNEKDSGIWLDAQNLHNLVSREYNSLTGSSGNNIHDDEYDDESDEDDAFDFTETTKSNKSKKSRGSAQTTTLKTRLGKLLKKKDSTGRSYAEAFMELPSKKEWAVYYDVIKKPMSFEMVEKKLGRGHYDSVQAFASDVELIFSNAFEFNREHSAIWNDAKYLQDQFRQLISDLLMPAVSAAAAPTVGASMKIKLKVGAQSQQPAETGTPLAQSKSSNAITVSEPRGTQALKQTSSLSTPATSSKALPHSGTTPSYPPTTSTTPAPSVVPLTAAQQAQPGSYPAGVANNAAAAYQNQVTQYIASWQAAGYSIQSLPPHLQQYLQQAQQAGQSPNATGTAGLNPYQGYTQWGGASPAQRGYTPNQTPPAYGSPLTGSVPLAGSVPPQGARANTSATPPVESSSSTQVATATSSKTQTAVDEPSVKFIKSVSFRTVPIGRRVMFSSIEGVDLRLWSLRLGVGETGAEIVGIEIFPTISSGEANGDRPRRQTRGRTTRRGAKGKGKEDDKMDSDEDDAVGDDVEEEERNRTPSTSREVDVKVNDITITPTPSVLPALAFLQDLSPDTTLVGSTPDNSAVNPVNGNGVAGDVSESEGESEEEDAEGDEDDAEGDDDDQPAARTRGKGRGNASRSRSPSKRQSSKSSPKSSRRLKSTKKKSGKNGISHHSDEAPIVDKRKWEFGLSLGRNVVEVKVGASNKAETWRVFMERVL